MAFELKNLRSVNTSPVQTPMLRPSRLFPTSGQFTAPMTCKTIIQSAKASGTKDSFLDIYSMNPARFSVSTSVSEFLNSLNAPNIDVNQDIAGNEGYPEIRQYVDTVKRETLPVLRLVKNCLRENLQPDISALQDKRQQLEESKRRYEVLVSPEQEVSYYEGWFPLFRPMSQSALFGIFGTALFLLLSSIGIFLTLQGVSLEFKLPPQSTLFEFSFASVKPYILPSIALGILLAYLGTR